MHHCNIYSTIATILAHNNVIFRLSWSDYYWKGVVKLKWWVLCIFLFFWRWLYLLGVDCRDYCLAGVFIENNLKSLFIHERGLSNWDFWNFAKSPILWLLLKKWGSDNSRYSIHPLALQGWFYKFQELFLWWVDSWNLTALFLKVFQMGNLVKCKHEIF